MISDIDSAYVKAGDPTSERHTYSNNRIYPPEEFLYFMIH